MATVTHSYNINDIVYKVDTTGKECGISKNKVVSVRIQVLPVGQSVTTLIEYMLEDQKTHVKSFYEESTIYADLPTALAAYQTYIDSI